MKKTLAIGLMSGTSLDGLDIALCEFENLAGKTKYRIIAAETIRYSTHWKLLLQHAPQLSSVELCSMEFEYGAFVGNQVSNFVQRHHCRPQFIASHGHTVFHQPDRGFTLQIGHGAAIAAEAGIDVVCDFRSPDVALGGQGAPLVPIGDRDLFGDYAFCLNLGGFANVSFQDESRRIAFDICPANIALNYYAKKLGHDFDKNGQVAAGGKIDEALLHRLNSLDFYQINKAKSLGREWLDSEFLPMIDDSELDTPGILSTLCEHIAIQINKALPANASGQILTTGGGAENGFLISRIRHHSKHTLLIPEKNLVHYKEALVFAYLGLLRLEDKINTLATVTGARRDCSGGCVYLA